jgi:ankyrin repeat protein
MLTISILPFIQATCKGVYPSVLYRFLKCNSSVNLCDTHGYTPLHVACRNGHIDIVNILLKCNSSVNLCDTHGYTPLHFACINGNIDIQHVKEYIHQCHIDLHYYYTSVRC